MQSKKLLIVMLTYFTVFSQASPSIYSHIITIDKSGNDLTADGSQYPFKTLPPALSLAKTLAQPSFRVRISIGPGTFGDGSTLALPSNVGLVGELEGGTRLNYAFSLNDSSWFNPSGSNDNRLYFEHLVLAGPASTIDFSTQQSDAGKVYFFAARANNDLIFIAYSNINQISIEQSWLFGELIFFGCNSQLLGTTIESSGTLKVNSSLATPTFLVLSGGWNQGSMVVYQDPFHPPVLVELASYRLDGTLTVEGSASVDARGSFVGGLLGAGSISRSMFATTYTTSSFGYFTIPIQPPFPDANYFVTITQTSDTAPTPATVTSKMPGYIVLRDLTGLNTWDIVIYHP